MHKKVGELVIEGEPLATLHVNDETHLEAASDALRAALRVGAEAPGGAPLIRDVLDS